MHKIKTEGWLSQQWHYGSEADGVPDTGNAAGEDMDELEERGDVDTGHP